MSTSLPSIIDSGSPADAIPEMVAASTPIRTSIVALLDLASQSLRLTMSFALATGLAAGLVTGLFLEGQQFKEVARSSRQAVRNAKSPQALSRQLRATSRQRRAAPLESLRRELNAAARKLELPLSSQDQRATTSN